MNAVFFRMARRFVVGMVIIWISQTLWGCATGRYGDLLYDCKVTNIFHNHSVPTEYNYYIDGSPQRPLAIIGLKSQYRLINHFWRAKTNRGDFVDLYQPLYRPNFREDRIAPLQGAWILDPQGHKIGIWYSMYPSAVICFSKDMQVEVYYR
jgi:hypothetical protein